MSRQTKATRVTAEEYLAIERRAETRSEYFNGEMFLMTGASRRHNVLAGNIFRKLGNQLEGKPCEAYINDMRVLIPAIGLYTYPDVVVVCGEPRFEDAELDTLLNPTLIVEVLSKSTASYDRGDKFKHYRTIPSFKEYLLVAQDEYRFEHYVKQADDRWVLTDIRGPSAQAELTSIGCVLSLANAYQRIELDKPAAPEGEAT